MFNEDPAKVSVLPKALPLRLAIPTQVAGDLLSLFLNEQATVAPRREKGTVMCNKNERTR